MKSRRDEMARHSANMLERASTCRFLVEKPEGKRPLGTLGIDGRLILKCIVKNYDGWPWINLTIGTIGGLF
jgi:hypothetical protein